MKKGFILTLTIQILLIASIFLTLRLKNIKTYVSILNEIDYIYERLEAEKALFEEILFNLSLYINEDFEFFYNDYFFDVKILFNDIKVDVIGDDFYVINLVYDDECICFIDITYQ